MTSLREAAQMALDAATEELPKVDERETVFCSIQGHHLRALCEFVRAALAQPEPEPVAWMYDWYDETEDIDGVPIGGIVSDCISKDYDEAHSPTMGCHNIRPLYTAPPQREWQGLTDEEIHSTDNYEEDRKMYRFARAIEDKLKEKNV